MIAFCLFSSLEYAQFWIFGGTCASLVTSHCHSVGFCIVVSALNSQAIQSKACISAAKYKKPLSFFWKLC